MQSTDSLIVHFLSFSSLLNSLLFIVCENLLNKCAKLTRQINAPKWLAKISCRENLPNSPARITRWVYLPEKPAISTRGLLARDPPFPAQNPQAGPGSPILPSPPPRLRQRSGGWGQGGGPAHPRILNRYFYLSHVWLHIRVKHNTYIFYTERIEWSINILL